MGISVFQSFGDVPEDQRQALSYPKQPNFFFTFDWFSLLFETSLAGILSPRIYVLSNGIDADAALFCGVPSSGGTRTLLSLTNFYTLEYGPSVVNAAGSMGSEQLAAYIASERPRWHTVRLHLMKNRALLGPLETARFSCFSFFQYDNWYTSTDGVPFDLYFSKRPSQLRHTVERKRKQLEKKHNFEIRLARSDLDSVAQLTSDFVAIYNGSWKKPEPFPEFIPALTRVGARLGILRLGVLYVDGRPAASQLWITAQKKAVIYKLAYDERYKQLGVGSILSAEMFRVAIDEDQVKEIDYGVGSEPYKRDWMDSVRTVEGIEAFNRRSGRGLLLGRLEAGKKFLKSMFNFFSPCDLPFPPTRL